MHLRETLLELSGRLAELEWKLGQSGMNIRVKMLPRGLFRYPKVERNMDYVEEIRADLAALSHHRGLESAEYLALKIQQKINVLVSICQVSKMTSPQAELTGLSMQSMMTRQQWLRNLEEDIVALDAQQLALLKAIACLDRKNIAAQHEARIALAVIEKRLTTAREAFERAVQ